MELRASALQDEETRDTTLNLDTLSSASLNVGDSGIGAVARKGVRVGLSINGHASPPVRDNLDMCSMDMLVVLNEMLAERAGVQFRRGHEILLRLDVDGVLDAVSCDNHAVVCMRVTVVRCKLSCCASMPHGKDSRGVDLAFEETADGHLRYCLSASGRVTVDLVHSDIVFSVSRCCESGHRVV